MLLPTTIPAVAAALQLSSSEPTSATSFFAALPAAVILGAAVVVLLAGLALLFVNRYVRCPANKILVISGRVGGEGAARCISGGGAFVWPVIQEYEYLSLEPMQIDVPLQDALSLENIRVSVPSVFTVAIGTEARRAAERGDPPARPDARPDQAQAQDIIFGQLRQVIASMSIEEINRDRETFLQRHAELARAGAQEDRPGAAST